MIISLRIVFHGPNVPGLLVRVFASINPCAEFEIHR
jgi:hypothetical protein